MRPNGRQIPALNTSTDALRGSLFSSYATKALQCQFFFFAASGDMHSKTSFEKNCFSAWASTLNMGLINKVDMVCLSPLGYGV